MALNLDESQLVRSACDLYNFQGQKALKFTMDACRKAKGRKFTKSTIGLVVYVLATKSPEYIPMALDAIDEDCVAIFNNARAFYERFKACEERSHYLSD